jgi:hypothetical protein
MPHFIPTSSSWLNLIKRWLGELTAKRIRRGVFVNVPAIIASIEEYLAVWNENPKPLVWRAALESIVEELARCSQTLEKIKPGYTTLSYRENKKE